MGSYQGAFGQGQQLFTVPQSQWLVRVIDAAKHAMSTESSQRLGVRRRFLFPADASRSFILAVIGPGVVFSFTCMYSCSTMFFPVLPLDW